MKRQFLAALCLVATAAACSSGSDVNKAAVTTKAATGSLAATTSPLIGGSTTAPAAAGIDPAVKPFCDAIDASSATSTVKLGDPAASLADKDAEAKQLLDAYDAIPAKAPAEIRAEVQLVVDFEHKLIELLRPVNYDNTKLLPTSPDGIKLEALRKELTPTQTKVSAFITAKCAPPAAVPTTPQKTTPTSVVPAKLAFGESPCPAPSGTDTPVLTFKSPPQLCISLKAKYTATFDTTEGTIVVELDPVRSPVGTNNFVFLVRNHYYDNTDIFRTDPGIDIIQGGSPHTQTNSDPGPGYTFFDDTLGYKYQAGDLVYANTGQPNTSSGQFFFATGPKVSLLDGQGTYITFGHTTKGLDLLQKIIALNSGGGSLGGKPSRAVTIKTVTVEESIG